MNKLKDAIPTATLLIIVAALFSWAGYRLIYQVLTDILLEFGIIGDYYQNIIILVGAGALLYLGGKRMKDLIK